MTSLPAVNELLAAFSAASSLDDLALALDEACGRFRFRHFAMVQHVDFGRTTSAGFRLHNYPERWVQWFDTEGLGPTDPVHRASHTTLTGFRWTQVPSMIPLSERDLAVLDAARVHGLADGFTVPAHVPGETLGSCSFTMAANDEISEAVLPLAQLAGQFAFEASRRLTGRRDCAASLALTSRQLECVMYVGRGKTDAEIAQILGVTHGTVVEHLRNARDRYNAAARSVLPVRALYDGALSFADILVR